MHQCTSSPIASVTGNMDRAGRSERGDGDVSVAGVQGCGGCWLFADVIRRLNLERGRRDNSSHIGYRTGRQKRFPWFRVSTPFVLSQCFCSDGAFEDHTCKFFMLAKSADPRNLLSFDLFKDRGSSTVRRCRLWPPPKLTIHTRKSPLRSVSRYQARPTTTLGWLAGRRP